LTGQINKNNKPVGQILFADIVLETWPDWSDLLQIFEKAMAAGKLNIINDVSHKFEPHGVTHIWLLSESHMAVHTWPENNYFAIDIFTCGNEGDPSAVLDYIKDNLNVQTYTVTRKARGMQ
tara:strand:+ start:175 stop:537 length:363 start_codon:yes stop_codon:yes gene_type:complete